MSPIFPYTTLFRSFKSLLLLRGKYLLRIDQGTRGGHHMISRNRNLYFIIAKRKRKLAPAEKLLVLPSLIVIKYTHSREELRNGVDVVVVLCKVFHPASLTIDHPVANVVRPRYLEGE